jgi:D-3-phosphoglycerate dehydrogenase
MDVGRAPDQKPSPGQATHIGGLTPPAIESQSLVTVRQVKAIICR